jgi:hypothetical protein
MPHGPVERHVNDEHRANLPGHDAAARGLGRRAGSSVHRGDTQCAGQDLLMRLEQRGWLGWGLWVLRKSDQVTAAHLDRLGVTSLWSQPNLKHPPGFYLLPEPWGGWKQGIEALPAFVSDLLAEPHMGRLRRQLADAEVDERHAFLLLGWNTWNPCCCTRERPAIFRRLRPSSQNRSMGYGLQASWRRYESSPGFLCVGGSKVGGGLRVCSPDLLHAIHGMPARTLLFLSVRPG